MTRFHSDCSYPIKQLPVPNHNTIPKWAGIFRSKQELLSNFKKSPNMRFNLSGNNRYKPYVAILYKYDLLSLESRFLPSDPGFDENVDQLFLCYHDQVPANGSS